jgi:hypothetical protein
LLVCANLLLGTLLDVYEEQGNDKEDAGSCTRYVLSCLAGTGHQSRELTLNKRHFSQQLLTGFLLVSKLTHLNGVACSARTAKPENADDQAHDQSFPLHL